MATLNGKTILKSITAFLHSTDVYVDGGYRILIAETAPMGVNVVSTPAGMDFIVQGMATGGNWDVVFTSNGMLGTTPVAVSGHATLLRGSPGSALYQVGIQIQEA